MRVLLLLLAGVAGTLLVGLPLAAKWGLGVRRCAVFLLLAGSLAAVAVVALDAVVAVPRAAVPPAVVLLASSLAVAVLAQRFYRDPERTPPEQAGPGMPVLSPADGVVVYVREEPAHVVPQSDKHGLPAVLEELAGTGLAAAPSTTIGISMSFLDVHVNRAPVSGRVVLSRHVPGSFGSLRDPANLRRNERVTTVLQSACGPVAVVQIASRLVRQVVSFVAEGDEVAAGQRTGVIRFGSQVDVVLARQGLRCAVQVGDRVLAAQTVLASVHREAHGVPAPSPGAGRRRTS